MLGGQASGAVDAVSFLANEERQAIRDAVGSYWAKQARLQGKPVGQPKCELCVLLAIYSNTR